VSPGKNAGVRLGTEAEDRYCLTGRDRDGLEQLGKELDARPAELGGRTLAMKLAADALRVRTREEGVGPLVVNAVQREFEETRGERNIVLKARQMGLTTWVAARFFLRTITRPGTLTLQVAHTQEAAEEIFRIVHRFYQWLGQELRSGPLKTSRANTRQLVFPELDSQYRVESAADRNAGRGMTVQNLHCSELARWPRDPAETLAGLRAALVPGAEMVLESTPDGVGGCFHDEWERADEIGLVKHFFPWWKEERYKAEAVDGASYSAEERELVARAGLSPEQIGYRRQIRSNFGRLARQEFAEDADSCFRMSGECYFDAETVDKRLREVASGEKQDWGELEVWLPAIASREYIVAVDPAGGGTAGDYSAMEVVDLETGAQCAEFAAHVGGLELARKSAELANKYNHAWLVVERNNHGCGVLAYLDSDCHYDRVYAQAGLVGWLTTPFSRPRALSDLASAVVAEPWKFLSPNFLRECRSFVRLPRGGIGARPGAHDDRVMAMAIALAARKEILERTT
jgi:hypothetical protein